MQKTYSGERIPGTIRYTVVSKDQVSIRKWEVPESIHHLDGFDHELSAQRIALTILQDHTKNPKIAETLYRDFKAFCGDLFKQDTWLLHSSRIDLFLKSEHADPVYTKV
ncbi:MAG: hypothetical protein O9301_07850 [Leptospira sp.]|nr:hypothetical protein [Leptospira sp.]